MEQTVLAPVNTPPIGTQTGTPAPATVTPAEDPATELARLRQEKIDLEKRVADKDKHINDLSTEKATLETRLSGVQAVESVTQGEPQAEGQQSATPAGTNVDQYVPRADLPVIIERTGFIEKMKADNKDMMDFGLEPVITMRADQLIRHEKKSFNEAVAIAVKEQREKFDKLKQPTTPTPAATVPAGLQSEAGAPAPVEPKPKAEEALGDEGGERARLRKLKGL